MLVQKVDGVEWEIPIRQGQGRSIKRAGYGRLVTIGIVSTNPHDYWCWYGARRQALKNRLSSKYEHHHLPSDHHSIGWGYGFV